MSDDWYSIQNASQVPSPMLLIYPERIRENLRRMIALAGDVRRLRPHVKTHKMPQVIAMKLAAGIDKFKVSTIAEAEMTAVAGGRDILMAYQPVGPNIQRWVRLIQSFPEVQFSTVIDNHESLQSIGVAACSAGVRVSLLLDLNVGMDRTGIEVGESAMELYRDLCNTPGIVAAGLHAYDGHLHDADLALLQQQSEQTFAPVLWMRKELIASGCSVPRIVAAGTPTTRFLCRYPDVEVGAGTTVLWDFGQTVISPDLQFLHAAVLLARVVSRPTANRLCIDLGHKAVASEMSHPRVRFFGLEDAATVMHSEEHLVLETSRAAHYPVGTVLYGLPRHVCPTVALQSDVGVVEDRVYVTTWPVVARTRCLTI